MIRGCTETVGTTREQLPTHRYLGGTFDPIHNAHLEMARRAMECARLDTVLFVVAGHPPHKGLSPVASPEARYAMVAAALANEPGLEPSRVELDRPGPSFTADTLRILKEQYPGAELLLIVGMDSLCDILKWREPETILRLARLLAVPRPGECVVPEALASHYDVVPFQETGLSSTEIRERLASSDGAVDELIPEPALRLIRERGIYDTLSQSSAH